MPNTFQQQSASGFILNLVMDYTGSQDESVKIAIYDSAIKQKIQDGFNINTKDSKGRTALFYAIENNDEVLVKALIDNNANVNIYDNRNNSPLTIAAYDEQLNIVKTLIGAGAELDNPINDNNDTLLINTIFHDNRDIAIELIKGGANANKTANNDCRPLTLAVEKQDVELANLLLQNGAYKSINNHNEHGLTLLMEAVCDRNSDMINLLIEWGADVNAKSNEGYAPLNFAIFPENSKIHFKTFLDVEIARILVNNGADINSCDNERKSLLDHAKEYRHTSMYCFLEDQVKKVTQNKMRTSRSFNKKKKAFVDKILENKNQEKRSPGLD